MKTDLIEKINSLALFYNAAKDPVIQSLYDACISEDDFTAKYSLFYHRLLESGYIDNWNGYVYSLVRYDDNIWTRSIACKNHISPAIIERAKSEISTLNKIASLNSHNLFGTNSSLFQWGSQDKDNLISYDGLVKDISQKGYGIWGRYDAFLYNEGNLKPIPDPSQISLSSLIGFTSQQEEIISNTKAFIEGKPANNVLLAGDRGAGKSSTVCGVFNMFKEHLKLIEMPLSEIKDINALIDTLKAVPHRFIIFLDDLVVDKDNINAFYPLKAALEGSMLGKSPNVLIYATSNRRHLVKESFQQREDEVNKSDGLEDTLALSDRFGLTILFQNLNKQEYLALISSLAQVHNIKISEQLKLDAEKWAIIKAVRSPRTAVQFINNVISGIEI